MAKQPSSKVWFVLYKPLIRWYQKYLYGKHDIMVSSKPLWDMGIVNGKGKQLYSAMLLDNGYNTIDMVDTNNGKGKIDVRLLRCPLLKEIYYASTFRNGREYYKPVAVKRKEHLRKPYRQEKAIWAKNGKKKVIPKGCTVEIPKPMRPVKIVDLRKELRREYKLRAKHVRRGSVRVEMVKQIAKHFKKRHTRVMIKQDKINELLQQSPFTDRTVKPNIFTYQEPSHENLLVQVKKGEVVTVIMGKWSVSVGSVDGLADGFYMWNEHYYRWEMKGTV